MQNDQRNEMIAIAIIEFADEVNLFPISGEISVKVTFKTHFWGFKFLKE